MYGRRKWIEEEYVNKKKKKKRRKERRKVKKGSEERNSNRCMGVGNKLRKITKTKTKTKNKTKQKTKTRKDKTHCSQGLECADPVLGRKIRLFLKLNGCITLKHLIVNFQFHRSWSMEYTNFAITHWFTLVRCVCIRLSPFYRSNRFFPNYLYLIEILDTWWFGLVSLFNGISTLFRLINAKAILLEEQ